MHNVQVMILSWFSFLLANTCRIPNLQRSVMNYRRESKRTDGQKKAQKQITTLENDLKKKGGKLATIIES